MIYDYLNGDYQNMRSESWESDQEMTYLGFDK